MSEAVVRHEHQNARGGRDACERSGEEAYQRSDVDQRAERRRAGHASKNVHRRVARAEVLPDDAKPHDFGVSAKHEERAAENRALNHGARDGFQGIARLRSKGGGAFEADKTEQSEHETKTQAASRHAAQTELAHVPVRAVADEHERQDDDDEENRNSLDP